MNQQNLYVGVDLRNDFTQISVLQPLKKEPEVLTDNEGNVKIKTQVTVPGGNEQIAGFLDKIYKQEAILVEGRESDPVNVLAAFFRKTLSMTKKNHPQDTIKRLVVTMEYRDYRFISTVYRALSKLGIDKDRAMVVDRRQSYIYYVMSQRKELWVNEVGLFDFQKNRLTYYQMQSDRFKRPTLIEVRERNYGDYLEMLTDSSTPKEERASIFEGMVQGAIHGQIITSLYMTGDGFADGFADDVMKKLCVGRHLFQGDNLYVNGACYLARELAGEKKLDEFVYLDEDSVPAHLTIQAYTDAKVQDLMLVKAGMPWYQVDYELDLIPDGDEELEVQVKHVITKEQTSHLIPMDGIPGRTERKVRISMQIRFAGPKTCILTLRDKGFGEVFPSMHRIWEETIKI